MKQSESGRVRKQIRTKVEQYESGTVRKQISTRNQFSTKTVGRRFTVGGHAIF